MKRFASNYLYLPDTGYLRQYAIEVDEEKGCITRVFPLVEELEAVSWLPGVIVLVPESGDNKLQLVRLYPFDFEIMQPTPQTKRVILWSAGEIPHTPQL